MDNADYRGLRQFFTRLIARGVFGVKGYLAPEHKDQPMTTRWAGIPNHYLGKRTLPRNPRGTPYLKRRKRAPQPEDEGKQLPPNNPYKRIIKKRRSMARRKPKKGRRSRKPRRRRRNAKRNIAFLSERLPNAGRILTSNATESGQLTTDMNKCNYLQVTFATATELAALMNKYNQVGEKDDFSERVETLALAGYSNFKLMWSIKSNMYMRNNTNFPAHIQCMLVVNRNDTSQSVLQDIESGFDDIATGDLAMEDDPTFYAKQSPLFRKNWRVMRFTSFTLQPGDEINKGFKSPVRVYDPDVVGAEAHTYHRGQGFAWLFRVEGVVSHDATTHTTVGLSSAVIDYVHKKSCKYQHVGRQQVKKWDGDVSGLGTMTNPAIYSHDTEVQDAIAQ